MLPYKLYTYDLETYRTCFLFTGKFFGTNEHHVFEISRRRNMRNELMSWLSYLQNAGVAMLGYNSLGFDYPVIHELLTNPYTFDALKAWTLAQNIFSSQHGHLNPHAVRLTDRIIPQIDLFKINHFDNPSKSTTLKALQFAMRSPSVEDLPFDPASDLTDEQIDLLIKYNIHDVDETERFGVKCMHLIEMRQELLDNGVLFGDVLNFSDVKIGTELLTKRIGRTKCFSGNKPRQTFRSEVAFKSVMLPKIEFRTEAFQAVHEWFSKQTIYLQSKERPTLQAKLGGLEFHFGVGGVHASVENRAYKSSDTHVIKDIDVSGMYVAVAVANGFAPEHLGHDFTNAYRQLQKDRAVYAKGTTMNAVLKLAGNGVYGNSNNTFSCFYDPKYTFSVTVNGQLQLLQLAEALSLIPGLRLIQANTDGITALVPRHLEHFFHLWKNDWESATGLKLEEVEYSAMWIRDVNNYVAVTSNGKVKRKGAYWFPETERDYEGVWNKDFSSMAVQKCVEQVLTHGAKPEDVILLIDNPFDFMIRYKTTAGSKVYIGNQQMAKTVRYYISTRGEAMYKVSQARGPVGQFKKSHSVTEETYNKIMPEIAPGTHDPRIHTKNKSRYEEVTTKIQSGFKVRECNRATDFDWSDVDYSYYIEEIKKLIIGGSL